MEIWVYKDRDYAIIILLQYNINSKKIIKFKVLVISGYKDRDIATIIQKNIYSKNWLFQIN